MGKERGRVRGGEQRAGNGGDEGRVDQTPDRIFIIAWIKLSKWSTWVKHQEVHDKIKTEMNSKENSELLLHFESSFTQ